MGQTISLEETVEEHLARSEAESKALFDELYPRDLKKLQDKKIAKQQRFSREQAEAEAEAQARKVQAEADASIDYEAEAEAEVGLFVGEDEVEEAAAPKLVRSSKGDIKTEQSPSAPNADDSDIEMVEEDPLTQWNPRKVRPNSAIAINTAKQPTPDPRNSAENAEILHPSPSSDEEEFVGFGHQISTQDAELAPRTTKNSVHTKPTTVGPASADLKKGAASRDIIAGTGASAASAKRRQDDPKPAKPSKKPRIAPSNSGTKPAEKASTGSSAASPRIAATSDDRRATATADQTAGKSKQADSTKSATPSLNSIGTFRKSRPTEGTKSSTKGTKAYRTQDVKITEITEIVERPPNWYTRLPASNKREKNYGNADTLLITLKTEILKVGKGQDPPESSLAKVRRALHQVQFEPVSRALLKKNRILHNDSGLLQFFDKKLTRAMVWPFDIRADAEELYNKWCREIFETDLMRGLRPGRPALMSANGKTVLRKHETTKINDDYPDRVSAKFYGNGLLLNGQWWPLQIAAVRDGAHGETIGGISASYGEPAYSCIISAGKEYHENEDRGDIVYYCGTDGDSEERPYKPSEGTKSLILNCENKKPLRLIRSHKVPEPEWRPVDGFRYDGLYDVVSYRLIDSADNPRQRYVFKLVRRNDQDPIRATGPEKRPTVQELEAYKKDRTNRGY